MHSISHTPAIILVLFSFITTYLYFIFIAFSPPIPLPQNRLTLPKLNLFYNPHPCYTNNHTSNTQNQHPISTRLSHDHLHLQHLLITTSFNKHIFFYPHIFSQPHTRSQPHIYSQPHIHSTTTHPLHNHKSLSKPPLPQAIEAIFPRVDSHIQQRHRARQTIW